MTAPRSPDAKSPKPMSSPNKVSKTQFAAIPVRALSDTRLSAIHFRALGVVAYHDRFSGPRSAGQGCWAGLRTMAREMGVHHTNASTALTDLVGWEYFDAKPHPMNRRTKVYRVIYDDLDIHTTADDGNSLPGGKPSETNGLAANFSVGEQAVSTVCPPAEKGLECQGNGPVEYIPRKREEILQKQEIDSVEAAPIPGIGAPVPGKHHSNTGGTLALIERGLRSGSELDADTEEMLRDIVANGDYGDPNRHRAERILETWGRPE